MKKFASFMLVLILLLTGFYIGAPRASAASKPEKTRAIAIVFDNSGTMYLGDDDSRKTWCRATYAMQALATMMNPSDTMQIYPMNPIQIGNSDNPDSNDVYTRERPLVIKQENASTIQEICTPKAGDTHIEALVKAREGLAQTTADEKWLILLTDGTVFYRNGKELSVQESIRQLTEEFNTSVAQVNAMYLGIGKDAQSGFAVSGNYQFVERKATNSAQVLANLTELGNIIFGRDALASVSDTVTFDISMKKLIVFIQGESIDNVALSGATPTGTSKLKYSTYGAKNYGNSIVCDTTLQGTMLTFENLAAGSYQISFSGQASDIAAYYEPDVDLDFIFTNADGSAVDPEALYEGEYKVSFGMKDAKTGQLTSSPLLGNPQYKGSYYINGTEYPISHNGYSGETSVTLSMNDTFDANLTATYLSGYTITKDSTDFGWPKGGIKVSARPAGDLQLRITDGDEFYPLDKLEKGSPFIAKVFYQGTQLTGSELEKVELKWDPKKSNAEIKKEFAEDHWKLFLCYKDPKAPEKTVCGECTVSIQASYVAQGSDEAKEQCPLTYNIKDEFAPLQMELFVPESYLVIKELKESKEIVVNLKLKGKPLTAEQLAAVKLDVDCGGLKYTVKPDEKNSAFKIKLQPTDGAKEGTCPLQVKATYTDQIGRETQAEDDASLTLSNTPLWVWWLAGILLLLLLIFIIWAIMHIKVLPKYAHISKNSNTRVLVDGEDVTKFCNFSSSPSSVVVKYSSTKFGLTFPVKPGKESYLYKKQVKRYAEVSNPATIKKIGNATIESVTLGSVRYVLNDKNILERQPASKAPLNLKHGAPIVYSGTFTSAGVKKSFNINTKLNFKKK